MSSVLRQKEFFWGALLNVANVGLMAGGMVQQSGQAKEQAKQAEVQAQKMDAQNAALNRIAKTQGGNPNAPVQMAQAMQERVRDFSDTRGSIMFRHRESGINRNGLFIGESLFSDVFMEKYFGKFPGRKVTMYNNRGPKPNKNLASVMSGQNKKTTGQVLNTSTVPGNTGSRNNTSTNANTGAGASIMAATGLGKNGIPLKSAGNNSNTGPSIHDLTKGLPFKSPTGSNISVTPLKGSTSPSVMSNKGGGTPTKTPGNSTTSYTNPNIKITGNTGNNSIMSKTPGNSTTSYTNPNIKITGNTGNNSIMSKTPGNSTTSYTNPNIKITGNKGGSTGQQKGNQKNGNGNKNQQGQQRSGGNNSPGNNTPPGNNGGNKVNVPDWAKKLYPRSGNSSGSQTNSTGNSSISMSNTPTNRYTSLSTQNSFKNLDVNNLSYNGKKLTPTNTNTPGNTQNTGKQNQQNQGNTAQQNPQTSNETAPTPTPTNTESSNNTSGTQQPAQQTEGDTGGGSKSSGRLRRLGGKLATAGKWAGGLAAAGTLATAGAGLYYTKKAFDDD